MFKIGCHVSIAGGVWNAPKNAYDLGCETFQIFTRSPQGGPAPELTPEIVDKFHQEMDKYYPSKNNSSQPPLLKRGGGIKTPSLSKEGERGVEFVVHCPYYINFGSGKPRTYHASVSIVREEMERASLLGAKFVMFHTGSGKDLGTTKSIKQAKDGLKKVLDGYTGSSQLLIEIAAGAGEILGDTFEELAEIMEPIKKHKGFGGVCFDTQHAWASGYNITKPDWVKQFDIAIGLKWLKMSHINDSKADLGARKDRHEHIGYGLIGKKGFESFLQSLQSNLKSEILNLKSIEAFPLILETEPDRMKADIKIIKALRDKALK